MDKETITTILAIWGAVVSSFAVGWQFFRDIIQRGRLRVSCYIGELIGDPGGIDPTDYLVYNVTNIGKEPVMLTHIGGEMKEKDFMVKTRQPLPRMLQPGEYTLEFTHDLSVLGPELKRLTAIDSIGRVWKVPKKQVKKLKADYAAGKYGTSKKNS
ncbi:MAG: hypothetical protein EPN22_17050 [Nitrospirae bacterium]|nr:MAG: hypothetical protein EPN22_17050 [Nitrospirota bacterium]